VKLSKDWGHRTLFMPEYPKKAGFADHLFAHHQWSYSTHVYIPKYLRQVRYALAAWTLLLG